MPKINRKNCDTCGVYYEKQNKFYCSKKCTPISPNFLRSKRFGGLKHTKETIIKKRSIQFGSNGSNWKGGISRCNANNFRSNEFSRKQSVEYIKKRKIIDVEFRISCNLRARINTAIRRGYKAGSAIKDLGCTIPELKIYLQDRFLRGMTWENHSRTGWHIDHIIPLSSFDLTDREQFLRAVHYTNLQPLWASDNIKKGNKIVQYGK